MSESSPKSKRWRFAATVIALAVAGSLFAVPAAANLSAEGSGNDIARTHPLRQAYADAQAGRLDVPDADHVVKLHCGSRVSDRGGAVQCEWRAGDDVDVRAWQLWNLQLRPARGHRNLVAELGADSNSFTDANVVVPGKYLYAVVGLDHDGEVIARSRVVSVRLHADVSDLEALAMTCAAHRGDAVGHVNVGCEWRPATSDAAAGYVIWKSTDGGERSVLARVGLDVTSVRDAEVAPGHRYTYVVTAVDRDGEVVGRSRAEVVGIPPLERPDVQSDRPVRDEQPERDIPVRDVKPERDAPARDVVVTDVPATDLEKSDVVTDERARAVRD